jgi:hypothetical protein
MRHIIILIIVCLLGFAFSGCNNLLNEPPENKVLQEKVDYTVKENVILPIVGLYGRVYMNHNWEHFPFISVRGDDVNSGGLGDQPQFADIDYYKYSRDFFMVNNVWVEYYQRILDSFNAEEEINAYKNGGADATVADRYIAETKVIRAFYLYYLSLLWGDVLIPATGDPTDLFTTPLSTQEEIMQYISNLMDEAIPALLDMHPRDRTDIPGGITKYAALAMKARANLYLKDYQKVAEATSEIIKSKRFELEPDFYELWYKNKGKLNKESLFEFQYSDLNTGSGTTELVNSATNEFFGPVGWTPKNSAVGQGWGFYEPSLKYIKFMIDRGETVRLETTVLFTPRGIAEIRKDPKYVNLPNWISNVTRSGDVLNDFNRAMFSAGKYIMPSVQNFPGRNSISYGKNFICIRYAEILLMHAEALVQGGTGSSISALEAVNLVRQRANMPNLNSVNLDDIANEKFAEMATEWGQRFYDCIRWGKFDELTYDGRIFSKEKSYYYYPQTQVDLLPVLRGIR